MADPDADLRRDVDTVVSCPLLAPGVTVVGWRYDVGTGLVDQVIDPVGGEGSGPTGRVVPGRSTAEYGLPNRRTARRSVI